MGWRWRREFRVRVRVRDKRQATSPLQEQDVGCARTYPQTYFSTTSTHQASNNGSVHNLADTHNTTTTNSTHTTSTANPSSNPEDLLLQLRKRYHKALSGLTTTNHHLHFLHDCKDNNKIPHGLHITQAFCPSTTDINNIFKSITEKAERDLRRPHRTLCTQRSHVKSPQ